MVSSDLHLTMASDAMVPSASWPSIDEDRSQDPLYVPSVIEVDDSLHQQKNSILHPHASERTL